MLGKLLKHELRATARVMLPLFGLLLALSVLGNFSTRILDSTEEPILNILGGLIIFAFSAALFAVCLMSIVIMVQRFNKNLLNDEGYLMLTLPTSVHSLVWSKLIVSVIWFVGTCAAVFLALMIVTFRVETVSSFIAQAHDALQHISVSYSLDYAAIVAEVLIMAFLGCAALCLLFYASMAVGYGFPRHKVLLSIVFFFLFQFATQFIGTAVVAISGKNLNIHIGPENLMAVWHEMVGIVIAAELVYCAVFYFITTFSLKKRLNLE